MPGCLIYLVVALLLAVGAMGAHAAESAFDRSKREAGQLFRDYLGSGGLSRCGVSPKWADEAVPNETAKKFLDANVIASLAALHSDSEPADIIDPGKKSPAAFCGNEMLTQLRSELRDALTADPAEVDYKLPAKQQTHVIEAYTFPVFNSRYDRAIIVAVSETSGYQKFRDGVRPCCQMVVGTAEMFRKRNGAWRHMESERLYHAH